jgi:hypothetical protein
MINIEIIKLLYVRFTIFYGHKFTQHHTPEIIEMWYSDWARALAGIEIEHIKTAVEHCMLNLNWPPTISEFIDICDKAAGMPTPEEAMQLAIRRDFTKPIVKEIFDKIGSWDMQHDSEAVLTKKFKEHHADAIQKFRTERKNQYLLNDQKEISHGSEKAKQGRFVDINEPRGNGMRKIESYLPH